MIAGRPMSSSAVERLRQGLDLVRARRLQPDRRHRLAEALAVLGLVDGVGGGADHLHVVFVEHAHLAQRQRAVERRLAAHGGKQGEPAGQDMALLGDDLGDDFRRDRLDIGGVRQVRVRHDGRRIGIDQDDPVALLLQRLAGLGAGIVEFAGLADDDGACADDQDRGNVGAFGHRLRLSRHKKGALVARPLPRRRSSSPARGCFRPDSAGREGPRGMPAGARQLCRCVDVIAAEALRCHPAALPLRVKILPPTQCGLPA